MSCDGDSAIRGQIEAVEDLLHSAAVRSRESRGRATFEDPCPMRSAFQIDRERIVHTNAFRRLKHKTQVFIAPTGDHYVTRLSHTLEVTYTARTIARALNVNEDLVEAIALGHDLGHAPFGHVGEQILDEMATNGFSHSRQSLRIVDSVEGRGSGLNLTWEVRQGIVAHSKPRGDFVSGPRAAGLTLEAQICRIADAVAYLNHDVKDAIRAGLISEMDIPEKVRSVMKIGMLDSMIRDVVEHSLLDESSFKNKHQAISMGDPMREAVNILREFMFDRVYLPTNSCQQGQTARLIMRFLYGYLVDHPEEIPKGYFSDEGTSEKATVDYLAGMTDYFALRMSERLQPGISGDIFERLF